MQRLFSKSAAAFVLSAERLFSLGKPVYFWTFTFVEVYNDWEYPVLWHGFIKALQDEHGHRGRACGILGLRVIEPHEHHGLHYHALFNRRLSVHIVRRVGKRFGMGRVHVVRANRNVPFYLAKYLAKKKEFGVRIRTWGGVGGFLCCRKNDVEVDSAFHRNMTKLHTRVGRKRRKVTMALATNVLGLSQLHGELENWPSSREKQAPRRGKIFDLPSRQRLPRENFADYGGLARHISVPTLRKHPLLK